MGKEAEALSRYFPEFLPSQFDDKNPDCERHTPPYRKTAFLKGFIFKSRNWWYRSSKRCGSEFSAPERLTGKSQ
jgi:hypothetical protein